MPKTCEEINARIRSGEAVVLTADEMTELVREQGAREASKKVDVVTTGTFGPMCSSGAFMNFGHTDPPIRMTKLLLNDVPVCADLAAVDAYIGATAISEMEGMSYGGAHVIQDFVDGRDISLKASGPGTDCYPRRSVETYINRETVNEAFLFNPRNAYQNYPCATNGSDHMIYTYMGTLLPRFRNVTYCSAGQMSPLLNDPYLRSIGIGSRIFLGGAKGYVAWRGTQFKQGPDRSEGGTPIGSGGTLSVIGDLKAMNSRFLRAARFMRYGVTLFVGIGIPIPILDEEMAQYAGVSDSDIYTRIYDYSEATCSRTAIREVSYAELMSGKVEINGKEAHTAPISSWRVAREIAQTLKDWINNGEFLLTQPVEGFPGESAPLPLIIRDQEGE